MHKFCYTLPLFGDQLEKLFSIDNFLLFCAISFDFLAVWLCLLIEIPDLLLQHKIFAIKNSASGKTVSWKSQKISRQLPAVSTIKAIKVSDWCSSYHHSSLSYFFSSLFSHSIGAYYGLHNDMLGKRTTKYDPLFSQCQHGKTKWAIQLCATP